MFFIANSLEIEELEGRVIQAKEKYQQAVYQAKGNDGAFSVLAQFNIHDKFLLNQDESWYTLSIEIQVPIDTVMLQACLV